MLSRTHRFSPAIVRAAVAVQWAAALLLRGQTLEPDPTFHPRFHMASGSVRALVPAGDGAVVVAGRFSSIGGVARNGLARLRDDGTVDPDFFSGPGLAGSASQDLGVIHAIIRQADGRFLIAGSFQMVHGVTRPRIARLEADGSLDPGFAPVAGADGRIAAIALDANGRILVGGDFSRYAGQPRPGVARLRSDGTLDDSFVPAFPGSGDPDIRSVSPADDGSVFVGGTLAGAAVVERLLPNGRRDPSFIHPAWRGIAWVVRALSDGRVWVGGSFLASVPRPGNLMRLLANGSADPTFTPGAGPSGTVASIEPAGPDAVWVGGGFSRYDGVQAPTVVRLNFAGVQDPDFVSDGVPRLSGIRSLLAASDGGLWTAADFHAAAPAPVQRMAPNGQPQAGFTPSVALAPTLVSGVAVAPGGMLYVTGLFDRCNGEPCGPVVRLFPDGSRDPGFDPGIDGTNAAVRNPRVQSSGHLVVSGRFTRNGGAEVYEGLTRLGPGGAVDPSFRFHPGHEEERGVTGSVLRPGDGLFVFRDYTESGSRVVNWLDADGTEEPSGAVLFNSEARGAWVLARDEALVAGAFQQSVLRDLPWLPVIRLRRGLGLDPLFQPPRTITGVAFSVAGLADGSVLLGGRDLRRRQEDPPAHVWRLRSDGGLLSEARLSLDPAQVILQLLPLPSGRVLAVASADAGPLAPRGTLHLLSASGEPVPGFPEAAQISEMLFDVALNTEGEVLVAGAMTSAWGLPADGLIRLVPAATLTLDHVQWSAEGRIRMDISGSRTEVILEQSPDLVRWQRIREVPMPAEGRITVEEAAPESRMWFRVRLP